MLHNRKGNQRFLSAFNIHVWLWSNLFTISYCKQAVHNIRTFIALKWASAQGLAEQR